MKRSHLTNTMDTSRHSDDMLCTLAITMAVAGRSVAPALISQVRRRGLLPVLGVADEHEFPTRIGAPEGVHRGCRAQAILDDISEPGTELRVPQNVRRAIEQLVADDPVHMTEDEFAARQQSIMDEMDKAGYGGQQ